MYEKYFKVLEYSICMSKVKSKCHNSENCFFLGKEQRIKLTFGRTNPYLDTICQTWINVHVLKSIFV